MAQVVGAVAAVGIGYLSSKLTPGIHERVLTFPPNQISRGGFLPLVYGRRVVGCHIGWVGDRVSHAAPNTGGGGSEITPQPSAGNVYYEGGWHQLCHGPMQRLYRIWAGSTLIWSRTLDVDEVDNGSLYQLPILNGARDADYFRIYFGTDPQPVNTYLQEHTGLPSFYPGLAYIMWQRKNLGGAPQWPTMRYEIETLP